MAQTESSPTSRPARTRNRAQRLFTTLHTSLYRLSGGSITGKFRGSPVLLLTTTDRKTGKKRTTPLLYLLDNEQVVLVASNGGSATPPTWWRNLQQNPRAEVQIKRSIMQVEARQATSEERERLWPRLVSMYPDYANYQKRTSRTIPVVLLQRTQ